MLFNNITYRVTSGTSRTMAGLNPGTSYTYCVRANNTVGSSAYSKVQTIVTTPNAPKVPANISATATENSVTVKWTASVGADSYDVKLGDKIYNVTGTSTTIMGLSPNTNYTYCVQAKNTGGTSGYSSSRTIRTLLGVPANVTASAETNSVTISWSAVSGASGYDVLFNNQTYSVTGTSKTITGLTPEQIIPTVSGQKIIWEPAPIRHQNRLPQSWPRRRFRLMSLPFPTYRQNPLQ